MLIIVGSRAVGDYKLNSDWDVYLFTDKKMPKETPREFYDSLPTSLKKRIFGCVQKLNGYQNKFRQALERSKKLKSRDGHKRKIWKKAKR